MFLVEAIFVDVVCAGVNFGWLGAVGFGHP